MRFPPVSLRSSTGSVTSGIGLSLLLLSVSAFCDIAHASGPVERLVQVLNDPSDPMHVVVRYGIASEGYLFSHDGGKTFKAMCSQAIKSASDDPALTRISSQTLSAVVPTLLDKTGKLLVAQNEALWSDDGTGCTWAKQADFDNKWPTSLLLDPKNPTELLALVTVASGTGDMTEAESRLMRRAADGTWTPWSGASPVKKHVANQRAYGGQLVGGSTAVSTRLYAALTVSVGAFTAPQTTMVVTSEDGGKTWTDAGTPTPDQQEGFTLLAVDPLEPKRVLAVVYRDSATDTLLLSEDAGKTFKAYGDIGEARGAVFAPDGRVFVGDAGYDPMGGVWTAPRLGMPLTLIAGTTPVDCIAYKADVSKLQICIGSRFGLLDPSTGVFEQLTSLVETESLLDCPGVDMLAVCKTQLNRGPSWCCAGHYPFTPFCGEYDVTMANGQRVYCGLTGRALDEMNGLGPAKDDAGTSTPTIPVDVTGKPSARDAGTPTAMSGGSSSVDAGHKHDAGTATTAKPITKKDDGCSVNAPGAGGFTGGLAGTLAALAALLLRSRRVARSPVRPRRPA